MDQLLTVKEIATALQLHPDTVQEMLRSGQIEGIKLPRGWRVTKEALGRYLRSRMVTGAKRGPKPKTKPAPS